MQSPSTQQTYTIRYQLPRDVLLRIWWKRMLWRRPALFIVCVVLFILCLSFYLVLHRDDGLYMAAIVTGICLLRPLIIYRTLAKAIDGNAQFTDPKTLEFSEAK